MATDHLYHDRHTTEFASNASFQHCNLSYFEGLTFALTSGTASFSFCDKLNVVLRQLDLSQLQTFYSKAQEAQ